MRLSRLDRSQVDAPTGEVFDEFQKARGNVPNMFRTMAAPTSLFAWAAVYASPTYASVPGAPVASTSKKR